MSSLDDAEQRYAETWSRDALAVYGDALLERGDPRGEVIALELHRLAGGAVRDDDLRTATRRWLGELADNPAILALHGGLAIALDDRVPRATLARLLDGRFARALRAVRIHTSGSLHVRALDQIAQFAHPLLSRLSIILEGDGTATLPGPLCDKLVGATPRLRTLELDGRAVAVGLVHPGVRRLRISGHDALSTLFRPGATHHDNVVELDFVGASSFAGGSMQGRARAFRSERLPALRKLDISRDRDGETLRALERDPIVDQLTHLRLPPIVGFGPRAHAQAILDRASKLTAIRVCYTARSLLHNSLRHPTAPVVVDPATQPVVSAHPAWTLEAGEHVVALAEPLVRFDERTNQPRGFWLSSLIGIVEDEDLGDGAVCELPTAVWRVALDHALKEPSAPGDPWRVAVVALSQQAAASWPAALTVRRAWPR